MQQLMIRNTCLDNNNAAKTLVSTMNNVEYGDNYFFQAR